jgi:hypothetical protein
MRGGDSSLPAEGLSIWRCSYAEKQSIGTVYFEKSREKSGI